MIDYLLTLFKFIEIHASIIGLILGGFYYVMRRKHDFLMLTKDFYENTESLQSELWISWSYIKEDEKNINDKMLTIISIQNLRNQICEKMRIKRPANNMFDLYYLDFNLTNLAVDKILFLDEYLKELKKDNNETVEDVNLRMDNVKLIKYLCGALQRPKTVYQREVQNEWKYFCKRYKLELWYYVLHLTPIIKLIRWIKLKIHLISFKFDK